MRILLIEDNQSILQLYERIFITHEVTSVADGEQALQLLSSSVQDYDLIVLDMHLEKVSGLDILRQIRQQSGETRVFAISADDTFRLAAQDLGIQRWMTKPIEIEELINAVQRLNGQQPRAAESSR